MQANAEELATLMQAKASPQPHLEQDDQDRHLLDSPKGVSSPGKGRVETVHEEAVAFPPARLRTWPA